MSIPKNPFSNLATVVNFTDKWNATDIRKIDGNDVVAIDEVDPDTGLAIITRGTVSVRDFVTSDRFSDLGTPEQRLQMLQRSTQQGENDGFRQSINYTPPLPISRQLQDYVKRINPVIEAVPPKVSNK